MWPNVGPIPRRQNASWAGAPRAICVLCAKTPGAGSFKIPTDLQRRDAMSEWTEIIDGLTDHLTLLRELGERTVSLDPELLRALGTRSAGGRVRVAAAPVAPQRPASASAPRSAASTAPVASVSRTPEQRRQALDEIAARIETCEACDLYKQRNRCVPGQGNPCAPDVMFIGEAPGADEDREGLAFIGAAGQFLTKMIEAMGYTRDDVFIANICKCRPPNNRTPVTDEMRTCLPFQRDQIRSVQPNHCAAGRHRYSRPVGDAGRCLAHTRGLDPLRGDPRDADLSPRVHSALRVSRRCRRAQARQDRGLARAQTCARTTRTHTAAR